MAHSDSNGVTGVLPPTSGDRRLEERNRFQNPFFLITLLALLLLIGLSACGRSPLLNHVNADDARGDRPLTTGDAGGAHDLPPVGETRAALPCDFKFVRSGVCAGIEWTAQPDLRTRTDGAFTLRFWKGTAPNTDGTFTAPPGDAVRGFLFMGSMGHGTGDDLEFATRDGSSGAVFSVTRVYPIMRGDWQIHLEIKSANAVLEEAILDCRFDGASMACANPDT